MPTIWTDDPAGSGTHIRAVHINEVRSAVDCNRSAYGLASYPWTDVPIGSGIHIRAVHFNEIRAAIQDLWSRKSMGTIPNWSVGSTPSSSRQISARDINNVRSWLNQYETSATGAVYSPLRGLHLRNANDMRAEDVTAAKMFDPRMVVVLSTDVLNTSTLNYLKSLTSNVEIFCRRYPTSFPNADYTTFEGYNNWLKDSGGNLVYRTGAASQQNPDVVAQDIVNKYDSFLTQQLKVTRFYPGNEPELEWFNFDAGLVDAYGYTSHHWDDLKAYYRDVYYQLQQRKGSRDIELYPPAFAQFAAVGIGIGGYNGDGSTTARLLNDGTKGLDHVRQVIEYYTNGTSVGRVNWHSYFWPGRQAEQSTYNFFPAWLKTDIANGYPARITEFGWYPDAFNAPCNANLDTTTSPCSGAPKSLTSWGDYNDFVRLRSGAGGAAVWMLSSASSQFAPFFAVDASGNLRPWFKKYACFLNANL